ncbi:MAG: hypothetical protein M0P20_04100 [Methanocorpusculum sp.]|nr:hypothetical protein [Methanocorpusculum sp.]
MDIKKDNGLTPVIATILLIALSVVLISVVSLSVISGINSFIPAENKVVGFTVVVNDNDTATVTPVSGKDFPYLQSYTVYLDNGYIQNVSNVLSGEIITNFDENVTRINIAGNFTDGMTALVFSGKVINESGEIVVEPTHGGYYGDGSWLNYTNVTQFADVLNDWYHTYYNTTKDALDPGTQGKEFTFTNLYPIIASQPIEISQENIASLITGDISVSVISGAGTILRAPGYDGALLIIGKTKNKVTITEGVLTIDGDKVNTLAQSPALIIESKGQLEIKQGGSLIVKNNYNAASGGNGGGIYNAGTISIAGIPYIQLINNVATNGGGIYNAGTLDKLKYTYITSNHAISLGGAIYNSGTVTNPDITYTGNTVGPSYTLDNRIYSPP